MGTDWQLRQRYGARDTVEAAISESMPHGKEAVMTDGPTDPRLELTIDDLMTLSAAVAIALPTINEVDRLRYQDLAAKLATILIRAQQFEDTQQADSQA
jgi:hypothetical protein